MFSSGAADDRRIPCGVRTWLAPSAGCRRIAERLGTDSIPSSERCKDDVLLRDVEAVDTQLIRARVRFEGDWHPLTSASKSDVRPACPALSRSLDGLKFAMVITRK